MKNNAPAHESTSPHHNKKKTKPKSNGRTLSPRNSQQLPRAPPCEGKTHKECPLEALLQPRPLWRKTLALADKGKQPKLKHFHSGKDPDALAAASHLWPATQLEQDFAPAVSEQPRLGEPQGEVGHTRSRTDWKLPSSLGSNAITPRPLFLQHLLRASPVLLPGVLSRQVSFPSHEATERDVTWILPQPRAQS